MKESDLTTLIKAGNTQEATEYINSRTTNQLNYEEVDNTGKSPFHWAVLKKNLEVTKALGQNLSEMALNLMDNEGNTALNYASILGDQGLIEAVAGITITPYDSYGLCFTMDVSGST